MYITTPRLAANAGKSRSELYRAASAHKLERIARGIYRSADAAPADLDLLEATIRQPMATLCLTSALSHYGLIDDIPRTIDIAIPRGTRIPAGNPAITWHRFDRETFEVGRTIMPIAGTDRNLGLHTAERAICDAFRLRGTLGYELPRDALKEWLRQGGKPAQLLNIAKQLPRTQGPILIALDFLT